MSADVVKFGEAAAQFHRDRKVFRMRVEGVAMRDIGDALGISVEQVHTSVARMVGGASPELRMQAMLLDLERLDKIISTYTKLAAGYRDDVGAEIPPSAEAAGVVMRALEQRARLLGLYAQPRSGNDPLDDIGPRETSTERLKRALDLVRGQPTTIDQSGQPVEDA